jgi:hypothetical protein
MQVKQRPIEAKAVAGPTTTIVAGYIVALAFAFWPALRDKIPADLQNQLPVMIAGVLSAIVAYFAPHTNRPDISPVTPEPMSAAEVVAELRRLVGQRPTGTATGLASSSVASQPVASGPASQPGGPA